MIISNLSNLLVGVTNRESWLNATDGIYASFPYISGYYAVPPSDLPSMLEKGSYVLNTQSLSHLVKVYDANEEHGINPLACPC